MAEVSFVRIGFIISLFGAFVNEKRKKGMAPEGGAYLFVRLTR
jgi:hypothetical protein